MSSTTSIHAGYTPAGPHYPVATPVYASTAYEFESYAAAAEMFALTRAGFTYTRTGNPTVAVLEQRLAALEGGVAAVATASGQSAVALALMALAGRGDAERPGGPGYDAGPRHLVAARQLYGGTVDLLTDTFADFGYHVDFVDQHDLDAWREAIGPQTRAVLVESISNPLAEPADVPAIADLAHAAGAALVVDNTLATPALLNPIAHGADVVVHSATKFLGGHGAALGGVIVDAGRFDWAADPAKWQQLAGPKERYVGDQTLVQRYGQLAFAMLVRSKYLHDVGPCIAPAAAAEISRGIETLPLRMAQHSANAEVLARHLAEHPAVAAVHHPAVRAARHPEHPSVAVASRDFSAGTGAVFAFDLAAGDGSDAAGVVERFIDALGVFKLVANLGDTRSLVAHPAAMTHCRMGAAARAAAGISDTTVRLSVGLEDPADLIADLDQALLTVHSSTLTTEGSVRA
ncbi:aminotransferase class V-fold PLP-dependent enzyme [Zhihengliuella flava]|uniref:homocysteine desulfhydrase n=1 Tax=Zhihengliuella flava TaxID=1285193 RepID=A0A931DCH3_9MICC|nr:aminotransferase class V-fold PLP-dependent enzyme [Zhihengliuella flava]MBG6084240.1 O-acetylhomoserine (thiol)-lyase [Zhihengliuella flava]